MPTYTYECKKCYCTHDIFHGMSVQPRVKCPQCGGRCKRLLGTGAGIIFKGSGFYETDYKEKHDRSSSRQKTGASLSEAGHTPKASSATVGK